MAYDTTDTEALRVRSEVRRFKEHVLVFVAVLAVLVLANIIAGGFWYAHFWLFWIALIWGVLIALQGIRLFGHDIGRDWEDRMVSHVMAARRNEPRPPPSPRQPGSPRAQPSPPSRPPMPAWPPSSARNSATPPAQAPIITPAPPHTAVVVAAETPPEPASPQPEPASSQEPLITPPPEPPKEAGA
jgi:hypothetical protein